ncbi:Calcium/calmodulin-dependent protein kinase type 1 [Tritrichomonas musculus]|uniref:Calcium/calmodulin-dependent protein kinase type 1 n=1 Tax=Tritrichomonas musculus TaxID=1915356 RepID=A0ABR2HH07_9EUKA
MSQKIGNYEIECLVSAEFQRRLFYAFDNHSKKVVIKESLVNQKNDLKKEYNTLSSIKHPNIIKPIDFFEQNDRFYMVMPRGLTDLFEYMNDHKIPNQTIQELMHSLFSAVRYLHDSQICHRNITPNNVIIFEDNSKQVFILSGFGQTINFNGDITDIIAGSNLFKAPELAENQSYTNKVDCWSLGILMYVLFKMVFPFDENNNPRVDALDLSEIPEQAADLISHLICLDPEKRFSAKQALEHPYFQNH